MLQYNGRDLLCFNKEQIWTIPNGKMRVVFDDGVVTTRGKNIKLSWYFWEFFRLDQAGIDAVDVQRADVHLSGDVLGVTVSAVIDDGKFAHARGSRRAKRVWFRAAAPPMQLQSGQARTSVSAAR